MVTAEPQHHSICPHCKRVLPALEIVEGNTLSLEVDCAEHGKHRELYKSDLNFYREVSRIVRSQCSLKSREPSDLVELTNAKIVGIDLTDRCNLQCPICFASANQAAIRPLSTEEILDALAAMPAKKKLEVTLLGGEPTLRDDLPTLIREIMGMGFRLKLITNGLRFDDQAYAENLRAAGLEWVIYQFDGFDAEIYRRLRGADLLAKKLRVLDIMGRLGYRICLATMVVAGVNDHQIGDLIRFGLRTKGVHHLALLPASTLGRDDLGLPSGHLQAEDVMDLVNAQTGGRIGRNDWLDTMRWMDRVYRMTRHIDFKQRVCFFSMPLIGSAEDFIPAVWLSQPTKLPKSLRHLPDAAYIVKNLFAIDGQAMPDELLYVSIEKMHGAAGIHLEDAGQCNTLYLTRMGLVPTCIYNAMYRGRISCGYS